MRIILRVAALVAVLGPSGAAQDRLRSDEFVSAETCRPCHEEIYQQWRSSHHSKAATDPVFWRLFQVALQQSGTRASAICITCHAPVATVGQELKVWEQLTFPTSLSAIAKEGVTCDFCHTISGQEFQGLNVTLGAYRAPHKGDTQIKYGSHADASTSAHKTQASSFLQDPKLCAVCHQVTHPLPGLMLQNTYSEWYYGPYRAEGRRCQDCHMPAYVGRGASEGAERPDTSAHVFQGGHSAMLKDAATVTLEGKVERRSRRRRIRIKALVLNARSGHQMPTGIPGIRQLWLDLKIATLQGEEVFSGRADYGLKLVDRAGDPALPWAAVKVSSDTRIAPRKTRTATFLYEPAGGAPRVELKVQATLYYRLVSESAAHSAGIEASEPIKVSSAHLSIAADGSFSKAPGR